VFSSKIGGVIGNFYNADGKFAYQRGGKYVTPFEYSTSNCVHSGRCRLQARSEAVEIIRCYPVAWILP
jgi:hypothetical protein